MFFMVNSRQSLNDPQAADRLELLLILLGHVPNIATNHAKPLLDSATQHIITR